MNSPEVQALTPVVEALESLGAPDRAEDIILYKLERYRVGGEISRPVPSAPRGGSASSDSGQSLHARVYRCASVSDDRRL